MTGFALALILLSAIAHAGWNLLAKRAGAGFAFTWLLQATAAALAAPLAAVAIVLQRPALGPVEASFMAGSGLLHVGYFLLLARGYRAGDFSLVYPLARGVGPLLASAIAVVVLGERPTPLAVAGALLIAAGVFALAGDPRALRRAGAGRAVQAALLTGLFIAAYTLWDKQAVAAAGIPPLVYFCGLTATSTALLLPLALRRWEDVRRTWAPHWRVTLVAGALMLVAYVLVLTALVLAPVSYVAPAREVGILFGVVLGARLLGEGHTRQRLAAAAAMVLGLVLLSVG
ncbi:MAG: EamA family transporter [Chloroflexi bacterium]|nr:EamA family transporter [Chloroflexota bacterium]